MAKINVKTLDGQDQIGSIKFYPDSAADCTIMGKHLMGMLGMDQQDLEPPDTEGVDAANKSPFRMLGRARVTLEYCGRTVKDTIHVVEEETDFLVSWDTCIGLNILHKNYPKPLDEEPPSARSISKNEKDAPSTRKDKDSAELVKRMLLMVGDRNEPSESDRKMLRDEILKEYADLQTL